MDEVTQQNGLISLLLGKVLDVIGNYMMKIEEVSSAKVLKTAVERKGNTSRKQKILIQSIIYQSKKWRETKLETLLKTALIFLRKSRQNKPNTILEISSDPFSALSAGGIVILQDIVKIINIVTSVKKLIMVLKIAMGGGARLSV